MFDQHLTDAWFNWQVELIQQFFYLLYVIRLILMNFDGKKSKY